MPGAKRERNKHPCPIPKCNGAVVNLPRHYEQVHPEMTQEDIERHLPGDSKKNSRRKLAWKCTVEGCIWTGDRLDKHLMSKHAMETNMAKEKFRQAKEAQTGVQPPKVRPTSIVNADTLSESFGEWYGSIEGGHYVPSTLSEQKTKEKVDQNRKVVRMVKTVLVYTFGQEDFHLARLPEMGDIGRGEQSVIVRLQSDRELKWGTVRNYLHCVNHFFSFLKAEKLATGHIASMEQKLGGCITSITQLSQTELQSRKIEDRDKVLKWADIGNCLCRSLTKKTRMRI